ncbi:hypothetical protein [Jiangella asiatica]|nr:hypothetical protein [Jiangella asiatica]
MRIILALRGEELSVNHLADIVFQAEHALGESAHGRAGVTAS